MAVSHDHLTGRLLGEVHGKGRRDVYGEFGFLPTRFSTLAKMPSLLGRETPQLIRRDIEGGRKKIRPILDDGTERCLGIARNVAGRSANASFSCASSIDSGRAGWGRGPIWALAVMRSDIADVAGPRQPVQVPRLLP